MVAVAGAVRVLWVSIIHWTMATETLWVLDQLLLVLMLVEILHTCAFPSARTFYWLRSHFLWWA